jgi:hypothetical protein
MAIPESEKISLEEFRLMADRAGLGLSTEELERLKPLYEVNLQHTKLLHSLDLKKEEIDMSFHPDWPDS